MSSRPCERVGVLFVCLGNICRSPLARVLFDHHAGVRGLRDRAFADSCGTGGWHEGEGADPRAVAAAARRGIDLAHTARPLRPLDDFPRFHRIIAMDRANKRDLLQRGAPEPRVRLAREFDPALAGKPDAHLDVPDPYYSNDAAFDRVCDMLDAACAGLLDALVRGHAMG